jgi:hypothetical protein
MGNFCGGIAILRLKRVTASIFAGRLTAYLNFQTGEVSTPPLSSAGAKALFPSKCICCTGYRELVQQVVRSTMFSFMLYVSRDDGDATTPCLSVEWRNWADSTVLTIVMKDK